MIECSKFMHLDELCQTDTHLPDGTDWHVQNCGECWKMDFSDCFNVFECTGTQKYLLLCLHFCHNQIFRVRKFIFTTRSEFWSNLYIFRWHESMDLGRGRCRCCVQCLCYWYYCVQMHLCTKKERYIIALIIIEKQLSEHITHISRPFYCNFFILH